MKDINGPLSGPRFTQTPAKVVECESCGWEGEVEVTIDQLSGVAGFRCPSCDVMQEPEVREP